MEENQRAHSTDTQKVGTMEHNSQRGEREGPFAFPPDIPQGKTRESQGDGIWERMMAKMLSRMMKD